MALSRAVPDQWVRGSTSRVTRYPGKSITGYTAQRVQASASKCDAPCTSAIPPQNPRCCGGVLEEIGQRWTCKISNSLRRHNQLSCWQRSCTTGRPRWPTCQGGVGFWLMSAASLPKNGSFACRARAFLKCNRPCRHQAELYSSRSPCRGQDPGGEVRGDGGTQRLPFS